MEEKALATTYEMRRLLEPNGSYELLTEGGVKLQVSLDLLSKLTTVPYGYRPPNQTELLLFGTMVLEHKLNPWLKQCWLVPMGKKEYCKYEPIVSAQAKLRMARKCQDYRGFKQGWITKDGTRHAAGRDSKALPDEVIGIWGEFYREGQESLYQETFTAEYKKSDSEYSSWGKLPMTMLQKVNRDHGIRLLFPELFDGMYTENEMARAPEAAYTNTTPSREERRAVKSEVILEPKTAVVAESTPPLADDATVTAMLQGLISEFMELLPAALELEEIKRQFAKTCSFICGGEIETYRTPAGFTLEKCMAIKAVFNKGLPQVIIDEIPTGEAANE